jgi:hypothetical protein
MDPNWARTDHGVLVPAGAGLTVTYPAGQALQQKNDGTNVWAKKGTAGYAGAPRLLKYPVVVDEFGNYQKALAWSPVNQKFNAGSVDFFYRGYFRTTDIVGASGGTNAVQTETLDADVDGGTRTLSFMGYTTAPIAWDASNATIQAALLLLPPLESGDVVVSGTTTQIFTFGGNWASTKVPLIVPNYSGLTDGGVAVVDDASAIVDTTPGVGSFTGMGRIIRGNAANGILELGPSWA